MQKFGHTPDIIMYTTMIYGLAKSRNIAQAYDLFEKLKARGRKPDSACYNSLITGLSNANRAMEAIKSFEEIRLKGYRIHVKSCIILLDALHRAENIEQASIIGAVLRESTKYQHTAKYL